jgi:hypothetical protein
VNYKLKRWELGAVQLDPEQHESLWVHYSHSVNNNPERFWTKWGAQRAADFYVFTLGLPPVYIIRKVRK